MCGAVCFAKTFGPRLSPCVKSRLSQFGFGERHCLTKTSSAFIFISIKQKATGSGAIFFRKFHKSQYYFRAKMAEAKPTTTASIFEQLNFDNKALRDLPFDDSVDPRVRRQVPGACFTSALQEPVENPDTVAVSLSALALLDITKDEAGREEFAEYFSGSKQLPGSKPAAHCYCGHQFGYFSGQLGDGAAMYLGEIVNKKGERWELQLKGSGPTPFSRSADGRKVLRSSLREFLCSEAMHYLGIPTTRAGSCVTSDTRVVRDIFYDGNPIMERASVISRIAPTFLRFGSFEIFKPVDQMTGRKGPSVGNKELLHKMLAYAISTFFPQTYQQFPEAGPDQYADFYKEVIIRTAQLVAKWQSVGFCHGVLNTDNMSILGITIDYGPFGFMDFYDPDHVCNGSGKVVFSCKCFEIGLHQNKESVTVYRKGVCFLTSALQPHSRLVGDLIGQIKPIKYAMFSIGLFRTTSEYIDDQGRYSYNNQPSICKWNLRKFAEALQDALPLDISLEILNMYDEEYSKAYLGLMRKKLGLLRKELDSDRDLINLLFKTMQETRADFTNTFRYLSKIEQSEADKESNEAILTYLASQCQTIEQMKKVTKTNTDPQQIQLLLRMLQAQPALVQQLGGGAVLQLQRELENIEKSKELENVTQEDKTKKDKELWTKWLNDYRKRLHVEFDDLDDLAALKDAQSRRFKTMNQSNPRIVLRNYVAQHVIEAAEEGNYEEVRHLLKLLKSPFSEVETADKDVKVNICSDADILKEQAVSKNDFSFQTASNILKNIDYQSTVPSWAIDLKVT